MVRAAGKKASILIADENAHNRKLVGEVLRTNGFDACHFAADGKSLLALTAKLGPRIVITTSRLPELSGLEFTRLIRAGHESIDRALSIIVMTNTPTMAFLDAARASGVDEMLAWPFTSAALLARIEAVLIRPRRFVQCASYVGPCRRRRMLQDYGGPLRRDSDPIETGDRAPWEAESNRQLVRRVVHDIGLQTSFLEAGDPAGLRSAVKSADELHHLAEEIEDEMMEHAAKSLSSYLSGLSVKEEPDKNVIAVHLGAMQKLTLLSAAQIAERQILIAGLDNARRQGAGHDRRGR